MRRLRPLRALSFDPGFSDLGWVSADVPRRVGLPSPLGCGIVATAKGDGPVRVDELRRVRELTAQVVALFDRVGPDFVTSEGFSPPRDASVAAKMAMVWTVVVTEAARRRLPYYEVTPQRLKKLVAGKSTATKDEVAAALGARYGYERVDRLLRAGGVARSEEEHPLDALGALDALFVEARDFYALVDVLSGSAV